MGGWIEDRVRLSTRMSETMKERKRIGVRTKERREDDLSFADSWESGAEVDEALERRSSDSVRLGDRRRRWCL